jgi:hypothetical protein
VLRIIVTLMVPPALLVVQWKLWVNRSFIGRKRAIKNALIIQREMGLDMEVVYTRKFGWTEIQKT